jgi:FlaA1/EpsC-like NDP-sugar epimerase
MKYFSNSNTTALPLTSALMSRGNTSFRYKGSVSIVLCAFAALFGFNAAVAIQLLSGMYILPLDIVLCSLLFAFLLFGRSKIAPPAPCVRNPREINMADLLEREVVPLEMSEAYAVLKGQVILVTGAAGSIGSELCKQLLNCEPELLIALDVNETGLFDLVEGLRSRAHPQVGRLYPFIGDITDVQRIARLFAEKRPTVVFHAAAYKHVPLLEQYPDLAIRTNALATYHLCRLAQEYEVAHFVFISTDKAAEPVSVMGASKWLGEMVIQSLAKSARGVTRFCAVRFGNVIGSRGSVVPIFSQQIEQGGPLTVTDPEATRYFMTIPEACGLVILTAAIADSGGLYLLDMGNPVRILDLAVKMIHMCGLRVSRDIPIVYTGLRPGERLHETLVAPEEELTLTIQGKIFCVTHKDDVPTLATISHWMQMLDDSLLNEDSAQLRELLFGIIGERDVVVAR